jgi:outer membrane immunogenic protein
VTGSDSNKLKGAIGGLQAGYNWQTAGFLVGVETDFQVSGQKGSQIFSASHVIISPSAPGNVSATYTQKLAWLGTLRGRVGIAADRWLLYATGGLAYGRVTIDGSATASGSNDPGCVGPFVNGLGTCPLASWSDGVTKTGWTIGAGVEGALTNNWS